MKQRYIFRLLIGLTLSCLAGGGWAKPKPTVSNIRVETDARRLKITFDLTGVIDNDSIYFLAESRTRGMLNTKTVTGDVGRHIKSGVNKVIYWDYALDGERIDGEIRPTVGVVEPPYTGPPVGGGAANALLSVVVPGLGNIRVQPKHQIGLRPLITVAYGGLLGYGLLKKSQSDRQYKLYQAEPFERNALPYYDEANRLNRQAWRAVQVAAVVLVADAVYTFIKGTQNTRQIRTFRQGIALNYIGNTPTVGFRLVF